MSRRRDDGLGAGEIAAAQTPPWGSVPAPRARVARSSTRSMTVAVTSVSVLRDPFGNPIRITQPPKGPIVAPSPPRSRRRFTGPALKPAAGASSPAQAGWIALTAVRVRQRIVSAGHSQALRGLLAKRSRSGLASSGDTARARSPSRSRVTICPRLLTKSTSSPNSPQRTDQADVQTACAACAPTPPSDRAAATARSSRTPDADLGMPEQP
jgi:hypothetical protein